MIIVLTRAPGSLFGTASRMEVGIKVPSAACAGNTHRVSPTSNFVRAVEGVSIMFTMQALAFDKLTSRRKYSELIDAASAQVASYVGTRPAKAADQRVGTRTSLMWHLIRQPADHSSAALVSGM
ncbi:hypothetical protein [Bradyrhizobium sp. USDA 4504]